MAAMPLRAARFLWQKLILAPTRGLQNNPIIYKEFRSRMRTRWAQAFLLAPTLLTSVVVMITSGLLYENNNSLNFESQRAVGSGIFAIVVIAQAVIAILIAPAVSAGALAGEHERQTYDLLRTTLLSARSLVLGKYVAAVAFIMLLILLQMPILSLAFFFGGIEPTEIVMHTTVNLVSVLYFCSAGIFISSLNRRILPATISTYVFVSMLAAILPMLFTFLGALFFSLLTFDHPSLSMEIVLAGLTLLFLASNPAAAMISSEMFLQEEQWFWHTEVTLKNGTTLYGPAPWLLYAIFNTLLALFFLYMTIRRVRRTER
ncbi:MAG: ABC transporter permease [Anaerolineales bacterium]